MNFEDYDEEQEVISTLQDLKKGIVDKIVADLSKTMPCGQFCC